MRFTPHSGLLPAARLKMLLAGFLIGAGALPPSVFWGNFPTGALATSFTALAGFAGAAFAGFAAGFTGFFTALAGLSVFLLVDFVLDLLFAIGAFDGVIGMKTPIQECAPFAKSRIESQADYIYPEALTFNGAVNNNNLHDHYYCNRRRQRIRQGHFGP